MTIIMGRITHTHLSFRLHASLHADNWSGCGPLDLSLYYTMRWVCVLVTSNVLKLPEKNATGSRFYPMHGVI